MPTAPECPRCRQPLAVDAAPGLCPTCLTGTTQDGATGGPSGPGVDTEQEPGPAANRPGHAAGLPTWADLSETVSYRSAEFTPVRRGIAPEDAVSIARVDFAQLIETLIQVGLMEKA